MPSCPRCRDKALSCLSSPGAKRCSECVLANNAQCGLEGPDIPSLQREKTELDAEREAVVAAQEANARRARRLRKREQAFEKKMARILFHEAAAVSELEEEERLEAQAAPSSLPLSPGWGAADIDQVLALGSPDPLTPLPSGQA
ncbi:hypothetical protein B0T26DRAFT_730921 [Lasiosphaeria miniovina]|uniref:Zn(2)-C6 fungal-type domain-containing protein n=1 Tax=Lasiosphaeria miniovina TaxID=1954250 RepID=A0AA40DH53_9PEZI|nr:uncharacterized protein B0T26DRAFT_730921 [Lasiosphaeria miniovina]KAK0703324.1 hypothetical protein B0T26DRAFT_730921 [Lasiosphaeria miniovina]